MKAIFLAVICSTLFLAGCEKNVAPENPLIGKWLWEKSAGGATGNDLKTPLPGTFKVLWILSDTEYLIDQGQDNYARMRYTVAPATDISTGQSVQGITFYDENNTPGIPQYYIIQGDQLVITDNITEPYTHHYRKVKED